MPTPTVLQLESEIAPVARFRGTGEHARCGPTRGPIPSDSGRARPFALLVCTVAAAADDLGARDPRPRQHGGAGVPRRHSGNGHGRRSDTHIRAESGREAFLRRSWGVPGEALLALPGVTIWGRAASAWPTIRSSGGIRSAPAIRSARAYGCQWPDGSPRWWPVIGRRRWPTESPRLGGYLSSVHLLPI